MILDLIKIMNLNYNFSSRHVRKKLKFLVPLSIVLVLFINKI